MPSFETIKITVPAWVVYILLLLLLTTAAGVLFFVISDNSIKMLTFIGGVLSGLVVFLITYITVIQPALTVEKFRKTGFINLLNNRHDKRYYQVLCHDAWHDVKVMGASCTRFVEDFLDLGSEDKILIDQLRRNAGLSVRLLVPAEGYMGPEAESRYATVANRIAQLRAEFGSRFEIRRFDHHAHHSFVIVDNQIVAGPIFDTDRSKYAPAVHIKLETVFGQKYNQHFNEEWDACAPQA